MLLRKWDALPEKMKCPEVKKYYDILKHKKLSLIAKRVFDVVVASLMLIILLPLMLILSIAIKLDSKGPVLFKQVRITTYGKEFKILKFRSMVKDADKGSGQLTTSSDMWVTRVGKAIRGLRLDELPQLVNIIIGDMSFVGTRPEVPRYVDQYSNAMLATLLLPAGVTSEASILYKDEDKLLNQASDVGKEYVEQVLPGKMHYNLESIKSFCFWNDIKTMVKTVAAVCGKNIDGQEEASTSKPYTTVKR